MYFIRSAQRQFIYRKVIESNLILNAKVKDFYQNFDFTKEEFQTVFNILMGAESIDIKENEYLTLLLPVLYYIAPYNQTVFQTYSKYYLDNNFLNKNNLSPLEKMHIIFNIIEFEKKYKIRQKEQLEQLFIELAKFSSVQKTLENYLLFKYYSALLKFIINDYSASKEFSLEIICDIKDQIENNSYVKNEVVNYIQIVNSLLSIKILEIEDPEKNKGEILDYLESLYQLAKTQKEEMAIKIGLKIYKLQSANMDYINCIKILEEVQKILNKEMLFGRTHKDIVEQFLHISGLLAYYNVLVGNFKEVKRYTKKINKSLNILKDSTDKRKSTSDKELVMKYDFLNSVMDAIVQKEQESKEDKEIKDVIDKFSSLDINRSFTEKEHMILNAFLLDEKKSYGVLGKNHEEILKKFSRILSENNQNISGEEVLGFYFYLYNNMFQMYNKIITGKPADVQGVIRSLKSSSFGLIDYTGRVTPTNQTIKNLFRAAYFKELFIRLFYFYMFCLYSEGHFQQAISEFEEKFNLYKIQFELTDDKGIYSLRKLKADCLFKLKKFKEAISEYSQIASYVKDKGTVYLNLGISYLFLKDTRSAKDCFEKAQKYFRDDRNKLQIINNLMEKLK